jgi:hypothetical protein
MLFFRCVFRYRFLRVLGDFLAQMLPKGSQMDPKWYQNAPSFCTCWAKGPTDAKYEATWCPNGPKLVPKWYQNDQKMEPTRPQMVKQGHPKIALEKKGGQEQRRTKKNHEEPRGTERNQEEPRSTKKDQEEPQRIRKNPEKNEAERRRAKNKKQKRCFPFSS